MPRERLEFFRPALIAGVISGLLSMVPFVGYLCCLWIAGGGILAARLLSKRASASLRPGDGALVGALTGIVAAIAQTILMTPLLRNPETFRRATEMMSKYGFGQPPIAIGSTGWIFLTLFVLSIMYAVIGILGGILGVALFGKKPMPPAPAAPPGPAAPPPAAPGP